MKVSKPVSIDLEVLNAVNEISGGNLSAFVNEALKEKVEREREKRKPKK